MKNHLKLFAIALAMLTFTSCGVVSGIFNAGMNFGIFLVVAIIVVIVVLIMRSRKRNP